MAAAVASDMSAAAHPAASSQYGRQARAVAAGSESACFRVGSRPCTRRCVATRARASKSAAAPEIAQKCNYKGAFMLHHLTLTTWDVDG